MASPENERSPDPELLREVPVSQTELDADLEFIDAAPPETGWTTTQISLLIAGLVVAGAVLMVGGWITS